MARRTNLEMAMEAVSERADADVTVEEGSTVAFDKRFGVSLTENQCRFVDEFLLHGNATLAIKRAGYTPGKKPDRVAYKVKNNPRVAEALRHGWIERRQRFNVDEGVVFDLLMTAYWNATEAGQHNAAVKATELLAKCFGMLQDVNLNFNQNKFVQVNDASLAEKVLPVLEKLGVMNGQNVTPEVLSGMLRERAGVTPMQIEGIVDDSDA